MTPTVPICQFLLTKSGGTQVYFSWMTQSEDGTELGAGQEQTELQHVPQAPHSPCNSTSAGTEDLVVVSLVWGKSSLRALSRLPGREWISLSRKSWPTNT